ncbi:MAG: twin-arginine translocation signal domain-containing protein, partial [Anaerolineaceae bacterium]|nr:twin-arginine translocation signal domain-containing protein [Anaerolineaceae bacterium]
MDGRNRKTANVSRRGFLKGAALVGAGSLIAACTPKATQEAMATEAPKAEAPAKAEVTLRFITNHGDADMPLFKAVLDNFAAAHSNIKIDHLDIGGQEFYNTINTQGAAKQLPDVWYTRTFDVPVYASRGWTVSLQNMIDADAKEVNVDDFWPAEVAQMKWKGELFALPYDFSNVGIYYNKKMFADAGEALPPESWKWEDLAVMGEKFAKKEGDAYTAWGMVLYNWNWVFHGLLFGWGGKVWTDDFSKCIINSKENADCLRFFVENRKKGLYPEAGAAPSGVDPFASGLVPLTFQGSWATVSMRDMIGDKFDFDCTAMPLSPTGASCINAAGGAWGIAANSKSIPDAWTFNKFITSTESTNVLISDPLRSIPGRKSSTDLWNKKAAEGGKPPKNAAVFGKQMEIANAAPFPPYWQDYGTAYNNILVPLIDGPATEEPEAVLAKLEEEVNRII